MANTPGSGQTGSTSSRFGGQNRRLNPNKNGKAGNSNTYGQAATGTYRTQAELQAARAKYLEQQQRIVRQRLNQLRASRGAAGAGFFKPGCQDTLKIYGYTKNNVPNGNQGRFLCKFPPFRETKYSTQPNELRIFVEGAEVSSYVRGNVGWSIQSSGGTNTARFTLNNDSDAFIITPANVCANLNLSGWRVTKDKRGNLYDYPGREGSRYDEVPKYQIYAKKYKIVNPEARQNSNIDETGMWLYPLNPYSVIFNKHDAVRIFSRMPHTTGVGRRRPKKEGWELWMPAFTGFIKNVSWSDDPVGGDRSVNIDCYDYRGLMDRMRIRTVGTRLGGNIDATKNKTHSKAIYGKINDKNGNPIYDKDVAQSRGKAFVELGLDPLIQQYAELDAQYYLLQCPDAGDATCQNQAGQKTRTDVNGVVDSFLKQIIIADKASAKLSDISGEGYKLRLGRNTKEIRFLQTEGAGRQLNQTPVSMKEALNTASQMLRLSDIQKWGGSDEGLVTLFSQELWTNAGRFPSARIPMAATLADAVRRGGYTQPPPPEQTGVTGTGIFTTQNSLQNVAADSTLAQSLYSALKRVNAITRVFNDNSIDIVSITGLDWNALVQWQNSGYSALQTVSNQLNDEAYKTKQQGEAAAKAIENLRNQLMQKIKDLQEKIRNIAKQKGAQQTNKVRDIVAQTKQARSNGQAKQPRVGVDPVAALYLKEPTFEGRVAGIFDDLTITVNKGSPHPLANMSFEEAAEWLICQQTKMVLGVREAIGKYKDGVLEAYNRNAVFGMIGRPVTYQEVTAIGKLTTSDYEKDVFSPINGFFHLLVPESGTGASTIVQADITANPANAQTIQYATRLSIINQICELLDFQFYVNPMGDCTVELPNYNILPADFGREFGGAYRVQLEWKGGDINEEATDLSTGWVFTGKEPEATGQRAMQDATVNHLFQKEAIISPILAKRLGVKVEHVRIEVPGVGAQIVPNDQRGGLDALRVWGLVYIQRQLGAAHTVSCRLPLRPFLLPNRPIHIVPRQRIGLINNLDYSCEPPMGECSVSIGTKYVRWLHRDGTFRTIAGGFRQPIDYTGFFTGVQSFRVKEGVVADMNHVSQTSYDAYRADLASQDRISNSLGVKAPRNTLAFSCAPALKDAYKDSQSSYGDDLGGFAGQAFKYGSSTAGSGGNAGTFSAYEGGNLAIGRPVSRVASSPGQNEPAKAVDLKGTGLRSSGTKDRDNTEYQKKPRYNLTKLFYNPYPFGTGNSRGNLPNGGASRFNNWINRYFDQANLTGYNSGARGGSYAWHTAKTVPHTGIDILAKEGTEILTPINSNWTFFRMKVGPWAEGSIKNPVKWVTFKNQAEAQEAAVFLVLKNGLPFFKEDKNGYKALVYIRQYKAWIDSGKFKIKGSQSLNSVVRGNASTGLSVYVNGYVQPPNLQKDPSVARGASLNKDNALYCQVAIAHCSFVSLKRGVPESKAMKGTVIARVGKTGTNIPHAHVDMWIIKKGMVPAKTRAGKKYLKEGNVSDEALFRAAASANREYMESLILLKVTGGKPDSGTLSPEWEKYFKERGVKVKDVREAVDILYKSNKWFQSNSNPDASKILTNAFFYFKPNEIVRGVNTYDDYQNVWYSTAPIQGTGDSDGSKNSVCGKLPEAYAKGLQTELKACLLKAGKYGGSYGKKKRLNCDRSYKKQLASLESQWKLRQQKDGGAVADRLNAQTDRGLRDKSQRVGARGGRERT